MRFAPTAAKLGTLTLVVASLLMSCSGHRARRSHDPAEVREFVTKAADRLADHADATDEQETRIDEIAGRLTEHVVGAMANRDSLRRIFLAQWRSDTPDTAALRVTIDERAEAYRLAAQALLGEMAQLHAVLTAEQRAKLADKIGRHGRRRWWH